jgi:hypothetical protein
MIRVRSPEPAPGGQGLICLSVELEQSDLPMSAAQEPKKVDNGHHEHVRAKGGASSSNQE